MEERERAAVGDEQKKMIGKEQRIERLSFSISTGREGREGEGKKGRAGLKVGVLAGWGNWRSWGRYGEDGDWYGDAIRGNAMLGGVVENEERRRATKGGTVECMRYRRKGEV